MIETLEQLFSDLDADGVYLVSEQQPHPYTEYVSSGKKEGEAVFRELVFRTFHKAQERGYSA